MPFLGFPQKALQENSPWQAQELLQPGHRRGVRRGQGLGEGTHLLRVGASDGRGLRLLRAPESEGAATAGPGTR